LFHDGEKAIYFNIGDLAEDGYSFIRPYKDILKAGSSLTDMKEMNSSPFIMYRATD
jgi:hypothetical protein